MLIGNLTRDPELRYTPAGMAVVSFGLATNRVWVTKQGERKEDAQFHRIVAWNKLAELCSQLLAKGRRVFVEGRIQYREFTDAEGNKKQVSEIVIDDMIVLDNKGVGERRAEVDVGAEVSVDQEPVAGGAEPPSIGDIVIPDELPVEEKKEEKTEETPF
jgi:single-strand DNA-binding protein